ncbi:MAG: DUF2235 domain-containing protein [Candidatus Eisenbacteria sp.]|nr:DUF2235 domain-containing protein [Candidatus Eisenbacteria bacterium]
MAKNIVICSDGTAATAAKNRGTNVFKLFEAVELHDQKSDPDETQQISFYDDGVGSQEWKPMKLLGGAFGYGLSRNVRQLYAELVRTYNPRPHLDQPERPGNEDDQIFLFGFSRGAFTVRTLAGMIARCGILDRSRFDTDKELRDAVEQAYSAYRLKHAAFFQRRFLKLMSRWKPLRLKEYIELHRVRKQTYGEPPTIRFVGVWDTVDAVGLPIAGAAHLLNMLFYRFKFSNTKLSPKVHMARQALSIDDERATFHPLIWDEAEEAGDRIRQVWFSGVHANVGGGYPKHGMSLVALDWMMAESESAGLRFVPGERARYRTLRNVNDKLYDSRSGAALCYRYWPRNIYRACQVRCVTPIIHISALERIAQGTEGYAPGNLPQECSFVETADLPRAKLVRACSRDLSVYLANQYDRNGESSAPGVFSLLDRVGRLVHLRHLSHVVSLCALAVLAVLLVRVSQALFDTWKPSSFGEWMKVVTAFWDGVLAGTSEALLALSLVAVLLVCLGFTELARARMHRVFSGFWCRTRRGLREKMAACLDPGGWTSAW